MKKILIFLLFVLFLSCDTHYKINYQINKRPEPIVIIAIDTTLDAVIMRDGNNKVFTIYNNPTTKAITSSLTVGDTLRPDSLFLNNKYIIKNF